MVSLLWQLKFSPFNKNPVAWGGGLETLPEDFQGLLTTLKQKASMGTSCCFMSAKIERTSLQASLWAKEVMEAV